MRFPKNSMLIPTQSIVCVGLRPCLSSSIVTPPRVPPGSPHSVLREGQGGAMLGQDVEDCRLVELSQTGYGRDL
jgi:hypothetical protein